MMTMAATRSNGKSRDPQDGPSRDALANQSRWAEMVKNAQRHSRKVRLLKFALPVLAVLMAAIFVVYSYVLAPSAALSVDITNSAVSDGKLVMANPKLDGFTKENLPYSMTAARAVQNLDMTGAIELEDIDAKLPVGAENWATVDAAKGIYDRDKNTLDITSEMTVTTTDGMVAKLKSAFIDMGKGDLRTSDAVNIKLEGSKVAADSMTILENGKVLVFEKRVRMEIDSGRLKARQQASGDPDAAN